MKNHLTGLLFSTLLICSSFSSTAQTVYQVDWTDTVGLDQTGLTLTKTADTNWGNAGAASTNVLGTSLDGWFEFTIVEAITNNTFAIGFSSTNVNAHYYTIRHALLVKNNGDVDYLDGGMGSGTITTYNIGDEFRMAREGIDIAIYKNGVEVHRVAKENNLSLVIDLAIFRINSSIGNIVASFGVTSLPGQGTLGGESGPWGLISGSSSDTYTTGAVAIQGTTVPTGYSLAVWGEIITSGVKVSLVESWPDYVFTSDYKLLSLKEIKKYIEQNGHLPGMPSAEKARSEGVELLEVSQKLLEKVEELTLHLIQQDEKLKEQTEKLKEQTEKLKKQQDEIEKLKKKVKRKG